MSSGYDETVYMPRVPADTDYWERLGGPPGYVNVQTTTQAGTPTISVTVEETSAALAILDDVPPEVARAIAQVLNEAADHIDPGGGGD